MELSTELISQFAKVVVKKEPRPESVTVTGTAKLYDGKIYVQIDGSNGQLTPIASSTVGMKDGDRVTVQIKNHSATVTGNATDPSPGKSYADDINNKVDDVSDQISEFEIVIADKVDVGQLNAVNGRIDNLVSENVTITGKLDAAEAEIDDLQADNVTITGKLDAAEADIDHLEASKADISVLESEYATIKNLEATNANIHNLEADYGSFKDLTTDNFTAVNGSITNLEANKLDVTEADIKYANIDFTNIGVAAVEELFAKSGIIEDLVVSGGHITGELVGVTIKGDLIEGNTIKADKLVVLGEDGLYYKLNVNAETVGAEQTEYNSLNGSIITANTITAEKINVDDLVAFNATIGGYHISDGSLYSGAKASATNTTRGVFLGDDGQFAVGDSNNYLRFINDNGTWKLEISAASIKMGGSSSSLDQEIEDLKDKADTSIKTQTEQFYLSSSPTALSGGTWSATPPTWQNGKYIWRRMLVTYQNGSTAYLPSANGVCITGNTGAQGPQGTPGADGSDGQDGAPGAPGEDGVGIASYTITYQAGTSGTTPPSGNWVSSPPTVSAGQYLWTRTVTTLSDGTSKTAYSVGRMGQNGAQGVQGPPGKDGANGKDGAAGKTSYFHVAYANSADGTVDFSTTTATNRTYMGTYVDYTQADSNSPSAYAWSLIKGADGKDGANGTPGKNGVDGKTYYLHIAYATNSTGTAGFSTTDPTGKTYIGQCVDLNQADPTTPASYSWSLIKGADGKDGTSVTINSTSVTYQAGTSGTTVPTGSWSTSVPSVAAGQYLWTRTIVKYSTDTTTTSYSVGRMGQNGAQGSPGAAGAPGKDGADGNGIKSKAITYQAGTSQTTAPTGTWTSTIPKLDTSKPYLWTRTVFTYDDNSTTTAYSVSSTLDSVEVGGRNMAIQTNKGVVFWSWDMQTGTATIEAVEVDGIQACKFTRDTTAQTGWSVIRYEKISSERYEPSTEYTVSFEVLPSVATAFTFAFKEFDGTDPLEASVKTVSSIPANVWTKISATLTTLASLPTSRGQTLYLTGMNSTPGVSYTFKNLKIERGNKATDWTPAPEDVQDGIDSAQNTADDALGSAEEAIERVSSAEVDIDSINATIQNLVRGQNGETLMTIDEDGVHFDFSSFQSQIANALNGVETVEGDLDAANSTIDSIKHQVGDLTELKSYINMGDDNGTPFIELGSKQGNFKVRITNTEMDFMEGTQKIAYITNKQLYIQSSVVTDELKIGDQQGYIWKRRSNNHMGLRYVSTN